MKSLLHSISLILIVLLLAVSCSNSNSVEDITGSVNFAGGEGRALSTQLNPPPAAEQLYWKYTASKSNGGLNTGAVTDRDVNNGLPGLNATVGPFSVGNWDFILKGFAKDSAGNPSLVYQGSTTGTEIRAGVINSVNVEVSYVGTQGKGRLSISQIYLKDRNNSILPAESVSVTIRPLSGSDTVSGPISLVKNSENKFSLSPTELEHGVYELVFSFKDAANWVNKNVTKTVLVLAGRTTDITGNVYEDTGEAAFTVTFRNDDPVIRISNYFYVTSTSIDDYQSAVDRARAYSQEHGVPAYVVFNNNVETSVGLTVNSPSTSSSREVTTPQVIIDLNGNTLNYSGRSSAIQVNDSSSSVTIQDGQGADGAIISTGLAVDVQRGSLAVTSGSISGLNAISVGSGASARITGGSLQGTSTAVMNNGSLTVSGGKINSENDAAVRTAGSLNVSGTSSLSGRSAVMVTSNDASVAVSGNSSLTATDPTMKAVVATSNVTDTGNISVGNSVAVNDNPVGQGSVTDNTGSLGGFGTETSPYLVADTDQFNNTILNQGTFVKFLGDITISYYNTLTFGYNMDLNGNTLYLDSPIFIRSANNVPFTQPFTIKNGIVISRISSGSALRFTSGAKFRADNVTFRSPVDGILIEKNSSNVEIMINDSTMTVNGNYGISTNADTQNGNVSEGINISVNHSNIIVERPSDYDSTGILFNVKGRLSVTGGSAVTAGRQAIILRGGEGHELKNSTLTVNGERNFNAYSDHYTNDSWGQGNQVDHAALVIGNKGNNAYAYPTSVQLENLKLVIPASTDHLALYVWQHSDSTNRKVSVSGTLSSDSATTVNANRNGAVFTVTDTVNQ